jgi:hypothetical protein
MAFSVEHNGPPRRRFLYAIRRQSDGGYWDAEGRRWADDPTYNRLPEQTTGHYCALLTATAKGEIYEVVVRPPIGANLLKSFVCDSKGKPVAPRPKGPNVNATMIQGILYVYGQPEKADVVLEAMSSNGITKYTAIRWAPSGIASCNCPGWTQSTRNRGKPLSERSCKHTKQVATMPTSVHLPSQILPASSTGPMPGTARAGRSIELD